MIDYNSFLKWAEEHFNEVDEHGGEIKVNSIFTDDEKLHLWCNPRKNCYHCWKTDAAGNLYELVSKVTGCSYHEAVSMFSDDNELRSLEARLDKFFASKEEPKKPVIPPHLAFPQDTFSIAKMTNTMYRKRAEDYLESRKLDSDGLMFCFTGKYRNRIIIPYYGPDGNLIYWNSRDITGKSTARYLGPDADEVGVGKGDVIYMKNWPKSDSKVYLTEGEFDAMSLTKCGINGAACGGKALMDKQVDLLRPYHVCVCFDTDKSGELALNKIGDKLIESGLRDVSFVRPPVDKRNPSKKMDWNGMLIEHGERIVAAYLAINEKPFTYWTSNKLRFNNR